VIISLDKRQRICITVGRISDAAEQQCHL